MNELKPCPFCGGKATLAWEFLNADETGDWVRGVAYCTECGCEGPPRSNSEEIRKEITEAWNTRQPNQEG